MYNRILVAVGGRETSFEPVRAAGRLACLLGAQIAVVTVHQPTSPVLGEPFYSETLIARITSADALLKDAGEIAESEGAHQPELEALEGEPAERILSLARDGRFDLIVMGNRGRGRLGAALLGSVSAAVAAHSSVPVMIVPQTL